MTVKKTPPLDLSDEKILTVMKCRPAGIMTYVIRNILDMEHGYRGLKTSAVLTRLKRMESQGRVERVSSQYSVQICWRQSDGASFLHKEWGVSVAGYGEERLVAISRGRALSDAWHSPAFAGMSFGDFLKRAKCKQAESGSPFGASIIVDGKPAFFVGADNAHVRFAYPGSVNISSAHPYEVFPIDLRPAAYRHEETAP
ncbi:MAG TPA: hypothetical protein VF503_20180 [Sphingobium sp.]|uniref:hypothetical protein n=1 Tax=Sphingobium sp. TaxID=1912891 RepID=UPI002ED1A952